MRSMPITAMCTRGTVVQRRPLPSFSTSTIEPVSATAKLQPGHTEVGGEETGSELLAGEGGEVLGLGSSVRPSCTSSCRMSRIWWRSRWTAGAMMWLGVWPASWMIHSPRSVSTTVQPAASSASFRPVSSVAIDLPFTTVRAPMRSATAVM